jgi:hypothetical protein
MAEKFGYTSLARDVLQEGLNEIRLSQDRYAMAIFLKGCADFLASNGNYEQAEKFIFDSFDFLKKESAFKDKAEGYWLLVSIEQERKNLAKRDEYLNILLTGYENQLKSEQSIVVKAMILTKMAKIYQFFEDDNNSLALFYKVSKIYEEINYIGPLADILLRIAYSEGKAGNRQASLEKWKSVEILVKGTGFYYQEMLAKFQLGIYYSTIKEF